MDQAHTCSLMKAIVARVSVPGTALKWLPGCVTADRGPCFPRWFQGVASVTPGPCLLCHPVKAPVRRLPERKFGADCGP